MTSETHEADLSEFDAALDRIDCLRGHEREVEELSGGLTNVNLKVTTSEQSVVVRIPQAGSELLSIDRRAEHLNSRAAADAGVGAPVLEFHEDPFLLVIGFLEGKTFTDDDLRDGAQLPRVAAACRQLHAGKRFVSDFDMFEVQRTYLGIVQEHGFRLPERYLEFADKVEQIQRVLKARPTETVPCNNDLLAGNFIDDGTKLWLIDYEYAGNNDACFELGNIWSEAVLPAPLLDVLVTAYFGRPRPVQVARARLFGLVAKYGWTLWASIQEGSSPTEMDFWSWGMEKYDRAVVEFDGPELHDLLAAARQPE